MCVCVCVCVCEYEDDTHVSQHVLLSEIVPRGHLLPPTDTNTRQKYTTILLYSYIMIYTYYYDAKVCLLSNLTPLQCILFFTIIL